MTETRARIHSKLHEAYAVQAFDNGDVWAGNLSVELDGIRYGAEMARAFLGPGRERVEARVRVELYLRDVDPSDVRQEDIDAHLWTDIDDRGFVDQRGVHHNGLGRHLPIRLAVDGKGRPRLSGNNLVFESEPVPIERTGVFHYTAEFSADPKPVSDPSKSWISINDITMNRDGVIAVSPEAVRRCPSVAEVCVRKVGASLRDGEFVSGTFREVTRRLEAIPADVIYLLPFFEPGFGDLFTGQDVRKGSLGSVYAVRDFFKIDPLLVGPFEEADLLGLASEGLILDFDLHDLLDGRQLTRLRRVEDLNNFRDFGALAGWVGRDRLVQLVGRAELRALTRRAHELGKRVIFDLVLMQTSRDCPLIERNPEWYVRDEEGRPRIHQIAWLVYSDVALLDLPFNKPLQNYLSAVAPFWIQACDLDGVRIDASQTVDRPFLKQIKNRIHDVKPDAIVLGETLCDLREAVDIPADMVYALLVDFHRDAGRARPYIEFLERTFGTFAPRTVALGYFENHDSPRATRIWRERYEGMLAADPDLAARWKSRSNGHEAELVMALLRNLQASLIDTTAGTARCVNLAYGLEFGSTWGEEARTDFEHPTLYESEEAGGPPRAGLRRSYEALHRLRGELTEFREGHIYFHRSEFPGGDPEDRVLAYTRYIPDFRLLAVHNLDPARERRVTCGMGGLEGEAWEEMQAEVVFDSWAFFREDPVPAEVAVEKEGVRVRLEPLQSLLIRLRRG